MRNFGEKNRKMRNFDFGATNTEIAPFPLSSPPPPHTPSHLHPLTRVL